MSIEHTIPTLLTAQGIKNIKSFKEKTSFNTPFQIPLLLLKHNPQDCFSTYYTFSGRNSLTNPENPPSWNDDAVVCDPWAESFYPAQLIETVLLEARDSSLSYTDPQDPNSYIRFPHLAKPRGQVKLRSTQIFDT